MAQYHTAGCLTRRSITLRGVTFFATIFLKTNFSAKPFFTVYQGPKWVRFMKRKKCKKSRDTASLNKLNLLPDAGMAMSGIIKEKIGYLGNFSLGIASALIAMFYAAVFLKVRICSCLSTHCHVLRSNLSQGAYV